VLYKSTLPLPLPFGANHGGARLTTLLSGNVNHLVAIIQQFITLD